MSKKLYEEASISDIADAIREKNGTQNQYTVVQMSEAVRSLEVREAVVQPLSATLNGIYNPPSGVDGFSPVTVNVSGGGHILSGNDVPSASLGSDGDIYKQTIPIPNNINFVEYLQSSRTQYIDTEVIPDQDTDVEATVIPLSDSNAQFFGARSGSAQSMYNVLYCASHDSGGISLTKAKNSTSYTESMATRTVNTEYKVKTNTSFDVDTQTSVCIRTIVGAHNKAVINAFQAFSCAGTMIIFGYRQDTTINASANAVSIKRLTLYENRIPIKDYLPCLDGNGIACMWDNIAGEYVYNDGTGDFAYGNTITPTELDPVYYVKKNGAWGVILQ